MKSCVRIGLLIACLLWSGNLLGLDVVSAEAVEPMSLQDALEHARESSKLVELADLTLEEARITYEEAKANHMVRPSAITVQQAENTWQAAQRNRELARIDLDMQVEQAFYDVLRANLALDLAKRSLEQSGVQLDSTQARYDQGMVSDVDLLAAQTQVASAEAELNRAEASQISARMAFNRILGRDLQASVELVDEFVYEPVAIDLEVALERALSTRLDLEQARNTAELRKKELEINDSPYSPALTKQRSDVGARKAELQAMEKELDVVLEVRQSYNTLTEAQRRIPIQQQNVTRAKESLRISQARFEAGVITSIDLIDAQRAVFQAETQMIQAVFDYNTQLARFYRSTGLTKE